MKWAVDYLKAVTVRSPSGHSRMELKPERMVVEADFYKYADDGSLEFHGNEHNRELPYHENLVIAFARGVWRSFEPVK